MLIRKVPRYRDKESKNLYLVIRSKKPSINSLVSARFSVNNNSYIKQSDNWIAILLFLEKNFGSEKNEKNKHWILQQIGVSKKQSLILVMDFYFETSKSQEAVFASFCKEINNQQKREKLSICLETYLETDKESF